jgi:hypothetical protein
MISGERLSRSRHLVGSEGESCQQGREGSVLFAETNSVLGGHIIWNLDAHNVLHQRHIRTTYNIPIKGKNGRFQR